MAIVATLIKSFVRRRVGRLHTASICVMALILAQTSPAPQAVWAKLGERAIGPSIVAVAATGNRVQQYGLLELSVQLQATFTNPFDPAQIDLYAIFQSPNGQSFRVNGFVYQDFSHTLSPTGFERLVLQGPTKQWRIRFSPPAAGTWGYIVYLRDTSGVTAASTMGSPVVVAPSQENGFVQVSRMDPHYLAYSNGASYYPVGENIAWSSHKNGAFEYASLFNTPGKLHDQGVNFVRIWLSPIDFSIEWSRPLGYFASRMGQAWKLDYVLQEAERDHIGILLSLEQFNTFSSPYWPYNPYNRTSGGPLTTPCDFFSDPTAEQMFLRNLRYVVARYGYSTSVVGWELFNEVDLTPGYSTCAAAVRTWHQTMAQALHDLDPVHHLVTTSFSQELGDPAIWQLPTIDLVQTHLYSSNLGATIVQDMRVLRAYGKPAWVGEFSSTFNLPSSWSDTTGKDIQVAIWSSFLSGAAGSGFTWWWDYYVDRFGVYGVFGPLARLAASVAEDQQAFEPLILSLPPTQTRSNSMILELRGRTTIIVGALASKSSLFGSAVRQIPIRLPVLANRCFRLRRWNTAGGAFSSSGFISCATNGILALPLGGDISSQVMVASAI